MVNFCTNCGNKLDKEANFCRNCGTKIIKNDIFCPNCGIKLGKNYNFCINCGTQINKSVKTPKEKEEEKKKKLEIIDEILGSDEIKSEIIENKCDLIHIIYIKDKLIDKIINQEVNMSERTIKYYIKNELKKIRITTEIEEARIELEKEMASKKIEESHMTQGGYCDSSCINYYEEFLDSGGGIVGDFDSEGYVEYYCRLGHSLGGFCKDYE